MSFIESLGWGVVLPVAITSIFLTLRWRRSDRWADLCGRLAAPAGFVAGYSVLFGQLAGWPTEAQQWTFYLGLILLVAGVASVFIHWRLGLFTHLVRALAVAGMSYIIMAPTLGSELSFAVITCFGAVGVLAAALWWFGELCENKLEAGLWPLAATVSYTGLSLLYLFSGSASIGQLVGVICAVLGVVSLFDFVLPHKRTGALVIPFVVLMSVPLAITAYYFLEVDGVHLALMTTPFIGLILYFFRAGKLKPWVKGLVLVGLSLFPMVWSLLEAYRQYASY